MLMLMVFIEDENERCKLQVFLLVFIDPSSCFYFIFLYFCCLCYVMLCLIRSSCFVYSSIAENCLSAEIPMCCVVCFAYY